VSDKKDESAAGLTLSRWSRRKHEAARAKAAPEPLPPAPVPVQPRQTVVAVPPAEEPLPPVESLTIDSDFTKFLGPKVDENIKRAALRKLFSDPRFNVMDGLDTYIDDYTKADPIPQDALAGLMQRFARSGPDAVAPPAAQPQSEAASDVRPRELASSSSADAGADASDGAPPAPCETQPAPGDEHSDPAALEPPPKPGETR